MIGWSLSISMHSQRITLMNPRIINMVMAYSIGIVPSRAINTGGCEDAVAKQIQALAMIRTFFLIFMVFWSIIAGICIIDIILRRVRKKAPQKRKVLWNSTFWL